jgi:hypothetical protein
MQADRQFIRVTWAAPHRPRDPTPINRTQAFRYPEFLDYMRRKKPSCYSVQLWTWLDFFHPFSGVDAMAERVKSGLSYEQNREQINRRNILSLVKRLKPQSDADSILLRGLEGAAHRILTTLQPPFDESAEAAEVPAKPVKGKTGPTAMR